MQRLLVAALCAVSGLATPVVSAGTTDPARTFVLTRTTSGPSHFDLSVSASPGPGGVLIGEADAYVRSGRVTRVDGGAIVGDNPQEQGLDAGNLHVRTCGYTGTCQPGGFDVTFLGVSYASDKSRGDVNALYVVVRGSRIQVTFRGRGWALREEPLTFRSQATRKAAIAGASISARGVAVTRGAQAPGGTTGSVAVAMPPCSISDIGGVARGIGQVTLTGGATTPRFICPAVTAPVLASYASRATTWRLTGLAAGDTTLADQALLVIDQPSTIPLAAR